MASKPVLWRNSSPNSRMPTTQRYSGWPHSQKIRIFSQNPRRNSPSNGASAQLRGRKKTGKRVTLEFSLILVANHANADQFKIVALGASNTAGYGVGPSQAFPAQLEALLRAKGYDVTISNAAVSGYTSRDILGTVDSAVAPGTKVVLVQYGRFNDRRKGLASAETQADVGAIVSRIRARGAKIITVNSGHLAPNFYQAR